MREDVVTDGDNPERVLKNAPKSGGWLLRGAEGGGVSCHRSPSESPLADDVRALVSGAERDGRLSSTPREYTHHMTVEQMAQPDTTLFVARDEASRGGMGALRRHGDGVGEVKRMYTLPEARGAELGARSSARIEALARRRASRVWCWRQVRISKLRGASMSAAVSRRAGRCWIIRPARGPRSTQRH